jgi:hypothetical protein
MDLTVLFAWERYFRCLPRASPAFRSPSRSAAPAAIGRWQASSGGVTLPLLAAYLGSTAAESPEAFSESQRASSPSRPRRRCTGRRALDFKPLAKETDSTTTGGSGCT